MTDTFHQRDLEAYLDEALPVEEMNAHREGPPRRSLGGPATGRHPGKARFGRDFLGRGLAPASAELPHAAGIGQLSPGSLARRCRAVCDVSHRNRRLSLLPGECGRPEEPAGRDAGRTALDRRRKYFQSIARTSATTVIGLSKPPVVKHEIRISCFFAIFLPQGAVHPSGTLNWNPCVCNSSCGGPAG